MVWRNSILQHTSPWHALENFWGKDELPQNLWRKRTRATYPPTNVYTGDDSVLVRAELPGFAPEDITAEVEGGVLTLNCERKDEAEGTSQTFVRRFQLPFKVAVDGVTAKIANGVLEVSVPRAEADRKKRIEVHG